MDLELNAIPVWMLLFMYACTCECTSMHGISCCIVAGRAIQAVLMGKQPRESPQGYSFKLLVTEPLPVNCFQHNACRASVGVPWPAYPERFLICFAMHVVSCRASKISVRLISVGNPCWSLHTWRALRASRLSVRGMSPEYM